MKVQALNGSSDKLTLTALKTAAGKATGRARASILGLIRSLTSQPAARGRSAKGASVKTKHHKRAGKKVTAHKKHNPTTSHKGYKSRGWHTKKRTTKHNPGKSSFAGKLNTSSILDSLKMGGLVALGSLGSSFVERQSEKFLPNLNPLVRALGAAAAVAAGALYFGGNGGQHVAAGSISEGIRSAAREYLPGLFAGTDDPDSIQGATGYWDESGQWVESMAGLAYSLTDPIPTTALRPAGI